MLSNLRNLIVILSLAVTLMLLTSIPATAAEQTFTASVSVNELLSFTIRDNGELGLDFGRLIPGNTNKAEISQSNNGSVTVAVGVETNVECSINTRADNFTSGLNTMAISNVKWNTKNDYSNANPMKQEFTLVTTLSPGESQDIWHWLSIPANQAPGDYTTKFYFQI